jgi:ATP-dependent Clp protease ATP-binding subunit ClpX
MFNKNTFGVPQFYPRDLKKRVDEYVVGQDRAKKTISSVIFNHYQNIRRRHHQAEQERKREEKLLRRHEARDRYAREKDQVHPVEGVLSQDSNRQNHAADATHEDEFPGHNESVHHTHQIWQHRDQEDDFYIPEDTSRTPPVKIDKSNLLCLGPTGVGKTYILEYVVEARPGPSNVILTRPAERLARKSTPLSLYVIATPSRRPDTLAKTLKPALSAC